ncbi:MAG: FtsX-like permease family protein [Desulfobacterales bacterium]
MSRQNISDISGIQVSDPMKDSVQRQVVLPFKQSLVISLKQIKVRFIRSLITTLSLVLAISFLSFVRVGNDVANGLLSTENPKFRQQLIMAGYDLGPDDNRVETSPKQRWILILSIMVCIVGIINAQLMAVTERFREIGTMKCLGALDRFVLRLFLLEAGMQGLVGSLAGGMAGAVFSLINSAVYFGSAALVHVLWMDVVFSVVFSVVVGFLLSLAGVFYPAIIASRMQPVEAMRSEH